MAQENRNIFLDQCFRELVSRLNDKKTVYGFKKEGERSITVKALFTQGIYLEKAINFFLSLDPQNLQKSFKKHPYPKVWKKALDSILNKEDINFNDFQKAVLLAQAIKKDSPKLLRDQELQSQYEQKISKFAEKIEGIKEKTIFHVFSKTIRACLFGKPSSRDKKNFPQYVNYIINSQDIDSILNNESIKKHVLLDVYPSGSFEEKVDKFRNKNPLKTLGELLGKGGFNKAYKFFTGNKENRVIRIHKYSNQEVFLPEDLPDSLYIVKNMIGNEKFDISKKYQGDLNHLLQKEGELSEEQFLQMAYSSMRGVKALHDAGIAHYDIKPANILYRRVKLENGSELILAAVADTDGCQFFGEGNRPERDPISTSAYCLNKLELRRRNIDSIKHDNYSLVISLLKLYLPREEAKNLSRHLMLYHHNILDENIKLQRNHAVDQAINNIANEPIKQLLMKLRDESLGEALKSECFKGVKEKFEAIGNKEKDKVEKYNSLRVEPQDYLKIQQRSFQKLMQDAEKIRKKPHNFSIEEKQQWREKANIVLKKNKGNPDIETLVRKAEKSVCSTILQDEKETLLINSLSNEIKRASFIVKGLSTQGKKIQAGELLKGASEEKVKAFFKDLLLNSFPKKLRKLFQEKGYRTSLPALREALRELINENNVEGPNPTEKTITNILVTLRAFEKYAPEALDEEAKETAKNLVKNYFRENEISGPINKNLDDFFAGENPSFAYKLINQGSLDALAKDYSKPNIFSFFKQQLQERLNDANRDEIHAPERHNSL